MKKHYIFLLVVLMCCFLGACSSNTQNNNETIDQENNQTDDTDEIDLFADVAEEVTFIVHVCINPEFELHADAAGYIVELNCLNEDAETAFANINVVGMHYEVGIKELLDAAYNEGYLINGSTIGITCYASKTCLDADTQTNRIDEALANYNDIVDFTYSLRQADHSGNIVCEIIKDDAVTTESTYRGNGILVKKKESTPDGSYRITEYGENGEINSQIELDAGTGERRQVQYTYNESGEIDFHTELNETTGKYRKFQYRYHENGDLVQVIVTDETGAVADVNMYVRDQNGSEIRDCTFNASLYDEVEYDTNGFISKLVRHDAGTSYTETETACFTDGIITSVETITDSVTGAGRATRVVTYIDGMQSSNICNQTNGYYDYAYFDANGNPTESGGYDPGNGYWSRIYNADGSYTTTYYVIDANGNRIDKCIIDSNGNRTYIQY